MADVNRANTISEIKNELFVESIKGLFLMNGGAAVALATWLQAVWDKEWATPMLEWQLWGLAMFAVGVFLAGFAFFARFLAFYHRMAHVPLQNPVWWLHVAASALSVMAFGIAAGLVVKGGFVALECRPIVGT